MPVTPASRSSEHYVSDQYDSSDEYEATDAPEATPEAVLEDRVVAISAAHGLCLRNYRLELSRLV